MKLKLIKLQGEIDQSTKQLDLKTKQNKTVFGFEWDEKLVNNKTD